MPNQASFSRIVYSVTIVATLLIATNSHAQQPSFGQPIKVMSFNIRFGAANDGANHWNNRKELVAETISVFSPDLLGVQEALDFQTKFLAEKMAGYEFFGRSREKNATTGEFCGIYFRKNRFTKTAGGHFWLSKTPNEAGSKSWDSSLPRMASWIKVTDQHSPGHEFIFANTHLDHRGATARAESAKVIRQQILESYPQTPVVLVGDFNTDESRVPYKTIIGAGAKRTMIDSFRAIHTERQSNEGTFSAWNGKRNGARIDWVLHTPEFTTNNAFIDHYNQQGRFPSDHYPVEAILKLRHKESKMEAKNNQ